MLKIEAIFFFCSGLLDALKPVSESIHAHGMMQSFTNMALGPYRRKTEQALVWLSSGPHSGLSKTIIFIHSCNQYLTASWQSVLVQHTPVYFVPLTIKRLSKRIAWQRIYEGTITFLATTQCLFIPTLLATVTKKQIRGFCNSKVLKLFHKFPQFGII